MNEFKDVRNILKVWASQVKGARGTVIADVTINAIERISKCLRLSSKFTDYIYEYRTREGALQSIIDYRDHFIHPFHVFCLGYFILDRWRESYPDNIIFTSIDRNPNICLKKWFIASIYHDVGYPSEKFENLVKEFFKSSVGRELKSQFDWSPVFLANENIEHIRELSKLFGTKNNNEIKNFEKWLYKRIAENHDHGVLSALMLLNEKYLFCWDQITPGNHRIFIEFIKQNYDVDWVMEKSNKYEIDEKGNITCKSSNNKYLSLIRQENEVKLNINGKIEDKFILREEEGKKNIYGKVWHEGDSDNDKTIALEAALAISIHNWRRPEQPDNVFDLDQLNVIHFPLAFFLTYCDTAQEWGRKVLLELSSKERISANTDKQDYDRLKEVNVDGKGAEVVILYGSKWKDKRKGDKNLDEVFKETGSTIENTWLIDRNNIDYDFNICGIDNKNKKNSTTIAPTRIV